MRKVILSLIVSLLCVLVACHSPKKEEENSVVYPTMTPVNKDTIFTTQYVAEIKSVKNIEVRAQEKGFLEEIYVDEGQTVKAGQVLFKIMPQLYQADVMKAQAELEQAEIDFQNVSTLAKNDIVSQNERATAKAKLDGAKADLKAAQTHLSFTVIKAPFGGVINRIPLKTGSLVNEGDLLTSLSDNSSIYTYFNLSETEYLNYRHEAEEKSNKNVKLILANGDLFPQEGVVQNIEGEFDDETGTIALRAMFPNPDQLLKNGQSGKILMDIPLRNVLIIPQKSTYELQGQKYVYVVDDKGVVKSRAITVAYELPDLYVLQSGLSKTDKFLIEGIQKVKEDDVVKTKLLKSDEVLQTLKLNAD